MEKKEIWRDVIGYEGRYQVSDLGRVKSFVKDGNGKLLKMFDSPTNDYLKVELWKNGSQSTKRVHQLVAEHFIDVPDNSLIMVVDHLDGNKTNNKAENLKYVSHRENSRQGNKKRTSHHTGVHWHKGHEKWASQISIGSEKIHLGYFLSEEEAAQAYQDKLSICEIESEKFLSRIENKTAFYPLFQEWCHKRDFPCILLEQIDMVFVCYSKGIPVYSCFFWRTPSTFSVIGFPFSDKDVPYEDKEGGLSFLFNHIAHYAKVSGFKMIWTTSDTPKVIESMLESGFGVADTKVDQYYKYLL